MMLGQIVRETLEQRLVVLLGDDLVTRMDMTESTPEKDGESAEHGGGADAFVREVAVQLAKARTVHHGHMPEIKLTGPDTATGIWAMEDIVEWPGGRILRGYGHYLENYRKVGGEWRIARTHLKRLRLDYVGPWPKTAAETNALMRTKEFYEGAA